MIINNQTPFQVKWAPGNDKEGRDQLIIIAKATYQLPPSGLNPMLATEQVAIVRNDVLSGKSGFSAVLYESDYASFKPFCDVLVNGCAYAPFGKPSKETPVQIKVNSQNKILLSKQFVVKGNRYWELGGLLGAFKPSPPESFLYMAVSYDNAFGGMDNSKPDHPRFYAHNPVGEGYSYYKNNFIGTFLANTEEMGKPIQSPDGNYRPMALGAIARANPLRAQYAGTYDDNWVQNTMPFWPDDFDYRFFQAAPPDQQIPYLKGGEVVTLLNFSSNAIIQFEVPQQRIPVLFIPYKGHSSYYKALLILC